MRFSDFSDRFDEIFDIEPQNLAALGVAGAAGASLLGRAAKGVAKWGYDKLAAPSKEKSAMRRLFLDLQSAIAQWGPNSPEVSDRVRHIGELFPSLQGMARNLVSRHAKP